MGLFRRIQQAARQVSYRANEALSGRRPPRMAFIHVPKTAGTSINSHFKDYIGSKKSGRCINYRDFRSAPLESFAEKAREARFVSGHMPWTVFESFRDPHTFSFTFLRDPFARLRSLYHHAANMPSQVRDDDQVRLVRGLSLEQFLASDHPDIRYRTDNYLARQLTGQMTFFPRTEKERAALAEQAVHNLTTLNFVGLVESFDQDFASIAAVACLPPPPRGKRVNDSSALVQTDEKKAAIKRELDDTLKREFFHLVEVDLRIYDHFLKLRKGEKGMALPKALEPLAGSEALQASDNLIS
jgi:hypothetical protein